MTRDPVAHNDETPVSTANRGLWWFPEGYCDQPSEFEVGLIRQMFTAPQRRRRSARAGELRCMLNGLVVIGGAQSTRGPSIVNTHAFRRFNDAFRHQSRDLALRTVSNLRQVASCETIRLIYGSHSALSGG